MWPANGDVKVEALTDDDIRKFVNGARNRNGCGNHSQGDLVVLALQQRVETVQRMASELRGMIDAMMRECGSEPSSRYARNACIIGSAAPGPLHRGGMQDG